MANPSLHSVSLLTWPASLAGLPSQGCRPRLGSQSIISQGLHQIYGTYIGAELCVRVNPWVKKGLHNTCA
jgi:hypothetical protein